MSKSLECRWQRNSSKTVSEIPGALQPLLQLATALGGIGTGLTAIATSGPGALIALGGLAEFSRQWALDKAIPPGPNHDQQVAEAQAGGIVTPDVGEHNAGSWGKLGEWFRNAKRPPPRGVINNNPGNIKYGDFAYRLGATGRDSSGFAIFPTMEAGVAAQRALLQTYLSQGNDTIRKVVSKYAPSSENDTAGYIAEVSKKLGLSPDQKLTSANVAALSDAMIAREIGVSASAVAAARAGGQYAIGSQGSRFSFGMGLQNAADIARQIVTASALVPNASGGTTNNSSAETHINGPITIQTQATDAAGIARDFGREMSRYQFSVSQANTGLS